jgi:hypothetical protein
MRSRASYPKHSGSPPPPLPAATRTVGQIVGESVKYYRENFFASLTLGLGPALTGIGAAALHHNAQLLYVLVVGSLLMTASFIGATILVRDMDIEPRPIVAAALAGFVVFLPAPFLVQIWVLPAVAWLGLLGLAVPAILAERLGITAGLRRALRLARADYAHAVGSLATLVLLSFLCSWVLYFLLRSQGEAVRNVAAFFSLLVISPILFIGSVYLYEDQRARVEAGLSRAERISARREHVRTAPREVVPTRLGRPPRPRKPKAGAEAE